MEVKFKSTQHFFDLMMDNVIVVDGEATVLSITKEDEAVVHGVTIDTTVSTVFIPKQNILDASVGFDSIKVLDQYGDEYDIRIMQSMTGHDLAKEVNEYATHD